FQPLAQSVHLMLGQRARLDFTLPVGGVAETVSVKAEAKPLLDSESAVLGTVVAQTSIATLPLAIRNWDDLLALVAGVQGDRYTEESGGGTSAGRTGGVNVHGIRSLQNNFLLDGVDNNSISENVQELSTQAAHPSVDTIQQFTIVTNPYSAEYGRAPGAALSVNTKGGSNGFHFLAFEYLRNDFFDATDYFTKHNNVRKAQNNQHQFGGSVSGPIVHDHLFAFFNYEGTRIKQGVSRTSTVPLQNERIGDFSPATAALLGVKYPTI